MVALMDTRMAAAGGHEMEPAVAPDFKNASVLRDWSYVTDPKRLVEKLMQAFAAWR